ncbi:hypothetical protein M409DRAFT_24195 [Zasmidium cellare ATCC 36951]|uniref:Uncharacterized protein n=1 Tax=Zasmidium cellare ATCC 36951 TaxID=1080233 RepID=A0A6A6CIV9_ZASCE|nr:uncharacterized protein M409DRAFT_24195 [Zasmidium cellare ATCC 36951]KAF2165346.1 hypothetical protein M409DRAFT_24195 [Zasmidium cellare ATCC 36951]
MSGNLLWVRLINAETLQLEEFIGDQVPQYYILSHRWGDDEITYKDFVKGRRKDSLGYRKILDCCEFVVRQHGNPSHLAGAALATDESTATHFGLYVWIDTCCIDKRSSAELSEAINSMYAYYRDAGICLVHLSDVAVDPSDASPSIGPGPSLLKQLAASSWFTRGWTLQELLAPKRVVFLDRQWRVIGRKGYFLLPDSKDHRSRFSSETYNQAFALDHYICQITGIHQKYFYDPSHLPNASIARRMSWAARRTTLRVEDMAYCLLGLFDVNIPLLYGEGPKAFIRLQEELLRKSNDHSIFAWWPPSDALRRFPPRYEYFRMGILAPSPAHFSHSGPIGQMPSVQMGARTRPYAMTNSGLELREMLRPVKLRGMENNSVYAMRLNCARKDDAVRIGGPVQIAFWHIGPWGRADGGYCRLVGVREMVVKENLIEEEGTLDGEERERVLYVRPVDEMVPIPTRV